MKEERKGELYLFSGEFLWAFFPVIAFLSFSALPPLVSLAWSTGFSALFFLVMIAVRKRWSELQSWELWKNMFGAVLFVGILYYVFLYIGLSKTTPGNAGIIALGEVFTSFIFFSLIKKEFFSFDNGAGSVLVIIGAVMVLARGYGGTHVGDALVLLAICFPPVGNYFQQKARTVASSESILFLRSAMTTPVIFLIAALFHAKAASGAVFHSLPILIGTGIFLLGISKIFWIEAIHRISVTKAAALSSIAPLVTLFLAWAILHQAPTAWQLLSFVPFFFGTLLLTGNLSLRK